MEQNEDGTQAGDQCWLCMHQPARAGFSKVTAGALCCGQTTLLPTLQGGLGSGWLKRWTSAQCKCFLNQVASQTRGLLLGHPLVTYMHCEEPCCESGYQREECGSMCSVGGRSMSVCACVWKFRVLMAQRVGPCTSVQCEMG